MSAASILIVARDWRQAEILRHVFGGAASAVFVTAPGGAIRARRFDTILRFYPDRPGSISEGKALGDWWSFAPTWLLPGGRIVNL